MSTCIGSSLPSSPNDPSFTLPRPRIAIFAPVSACMRFCVFPRGPMMRPKKLYPGCSRVWMKILRVLAHGLNPGGGEKWSGHRRIRRSISASSRSFVSSRISLSRVFTRRPSRSYTGAVYEGSDARSGSGKPSPEIFESGAASRAFSSEAPGAAAIAPIAVAVRSASFTGAPARYARATTARSR